MYLQPIAAWSGLALLLFLRLTKVHSLLLIYDLTDRAALKHVRTLATKRAHMLSPDEYGNVSEDAWDKHLTTFIKKTLLPEFQRRKIDHLLAKDPKRHLAASGHGSIGSSTDTSRLSQRSNWTIR